MISLLQKARMESGRTIDDIADHLKIRKQYLVALEKGDLEALPNMAYANGYLKLYANYLGVDLPYNTKGNSTTNKIHAKKQIIIHHKFQKYIVIISILMLMVIIVGYRLIFLDNLDIEAISVIENSDYVTKREN